MIGVLKGWAAKAASTTPAGEEPPRWIIIAIVSWVEAEVMRSKLASEGIPCLLQRETAGAVFGITIGPLGEVRVLVPEPLADRAIELLTVHSGGEDSDESSDESDDWMDDQSEVETDP